LKIFVKSLPTSLCPPGQRPLWVGDQREEIRVSPFGLFIPVESRGKRGLRGIL